MIRDSPYNSVFERLVTRPPSPHTRCDDDVTAMTPRGPSTREAYALQLAADGTSLLARSIDKFVRSTVESGLTDSSIVLSNVRQFMSGMINYLINDVEDEFQKAAETERRQLTSTEFLNLDQVLERVMNRLVLKELRDHIYSLMVNEYEFKGFIPSMVENIHYAKFTSIQDFAARGNLIPPKENDLKQISECFKRLQVAFMPSEKLEHLLSAVTIIKNSVNTYNQKMDVNIVIGGDDFLPLMIWVLVQCNVYTAELEVIYINKLLHPSLITGEGGYYLTTLSGAVEILKSFKSTMEASTANGVKTILNFPDTLGYDPLNELEYVLKVVVPDETKGSLLTTTLPVKPYMNVRAVCKIIAQKLRITNPEDYYLFTLIDTQEHLLPEYECPQVIKSFTTDRGSHCLFVYKRIDVKKNWSHSL